MKTLNNFEIKKINISNCVYGGANEIEDSCKGKITSHKIVDCLGENPTEYGDWTDDGCCP